ncbi:MAG: TIGR01777 family protein [Acidobacteria bacterium]|nr:TIGR01777 family protein [Acidobacteriota bacterium]
MKLVVAGGSGFLGAPLCESWAEDGHDVRLLTRALAPGEARHDSGTGVPGLTRVGWRPDASEGMLAAVVDGAAAVINLAGESVAGGRWTPARKRALRDSRILSTRTLVAAMRACSTPPRTFISGSAIGYYGARGHDPLVESSPPGDDFLARLCVDWEAEAQRAAGPSVRVVVLRTGIVLERGGGALQKMMLPFRFFAGGRIGSGGQYVSWIHRIDWMEMVRWLVETPEIAGPVNATAPHPVTNADLAKALGRAMHRPALAPAPGFALRLALGEMAHSLLTGQRVVPSRALNAGFHFRYPEIEIAFRGIFGG